ncbi:transglycosylase domain-containing protein [Clostridium sp. 'White wine YQ']|uniref:transglycosylase domain-containing protein n=1 Tax=Clostridium sp. 'White wine YQ' TaxID=3027474 RepID=UPI00236517E9|nr:PBP1A family penicillin-binding protein [Clostridium sp. 'White wine YQ']MDD7793130.1 PBP1A family penicillin-binding protein [Clostridium sp. 'White wine YQ']
MNKASSTNKSDPKTKNKSKSKKRKKGRIFRNILLSLFFIALTLLVVAGGYAYAIIKNAPDLDVNSVLNLSQPSTLYDNDGNVIDTVHSDEERRIIPFKDMPDNLKNAYVSIEDERFYEHSGVDVKRILGSVLIDVKNKVSGKSGLHGGSTLTQQLLKNTILTNEVSLNRKIKEAYLATRLEKLLSKDQILEAYLNTIPLGGKIYGVEAASMYFFGKPAKELNLIQCAYIAGLTQAPSYYSAYNPTMQKDPTPYLNRTKTVVTKMKDLGKISQADYDQAIKDIDGKKFEFKTQTISYKLNYEWFSNPVISQVKKDLKEQLKLSDDEVSKLIANGGLKIYTTMDKELQDYTQSVLDDRNNFNVGNPEVLDENGIPKLQAAAVIMDYHTGEVKAMVGGRKEPKAANSLNRAYNVLKPIGSSTKPLTVYGPGIDMKLINPATGINDAPIPKEIGMKYSTDGKAYDPRNQSRNDFSGLISIREGLRYSKNIVAVLTEDKVGIKNGVAYGEKFGLKYNNQSRTSIASVALGQFNNDPSDPDGGNPYKMAAAYGTFGNNGTYTEGILYTKVQDATGKVLLEKKPETRSVLSPQASYITYDLLKEPVEHYTASHAKWGSMPVAGKTGTTTENKDLWFAGLTPYLSAAIWVGYDVPTEIKGESGAVVTPIWGKIMEKAHEGLADKEIPVPSGIKKMALCSLSGKIPTDLCSKDPRGSKVVEDWVIDGAEPTETCDVHVSAKVNKLNNKLATDNTPKELVEERVFIKKPWNTDNSYVKDAQYILPTEQDDYTVQPTKSPTTGVPVQGNQPANNNDSNVDLDGNETNNTGKPKNN